MNQPSHYHTTLMCYQVSTVLVETFFILSDWDLFLSSDQTVPVFLRFSLLQAFQPKNVMPKVFLSLMPIGVVVEVFFY